MAVHDLTWAVGELAELSTRDFEIDELLRRLCEVAADSLPVDGVGVMKTDESAATRFVHASDPPLIDLEIEQESGQHGPCRDAVDTGRMIEADRPEHMRWPTFDRVAATAGVQALLAVPLTTRGRVWGVLDLYWRSEHRPDHQDRTAAQLLATVAVSYLAMAQDRMQARTAHELLAYQVLHDQLTGLPNRSLIEELIDHALAAAGRRRTSVAVLFIDLDGFKKINDTHGHRTGDEVLRTVARRLRRSVRVGDVAGRISGDEFVVVCEDIPAGDSATQVLTDLGQRIRAAVARPMTPTDLDAAVLVTASIGIAVTTGHPSAAALIHAADTAMYRAKAAGGDGIVTTGHAAGAGT